jgi:hypothetical protein
MRNHLQALGLGNGYLQQISRGLEIHFDRYSKNETLRYHFVGELTLVGNLFDDRAVVDYLIPALEHPYSYSDSLLLGCNPNLGDVTAIRLAQLIQNNTKKQKAPVAPDQSSNDPIEGTLLTWLEMGGTAITPKGIATLFQAMGTRPFTYFGLEYTDVKFPFLRMAPWLWFSNIRPISASSSLAQLHQAKYLQQISLTGNGLRDDDMPILVDNVLATSITSLGLINNRIGPTGVSHLVPLTHRLTRLELGINGKIGDSGAVQLAQALNATKNNNDTTTLEELLLFQTGITETGAEAFLTIFPQNKHLKYLGLSVGNKAENGIRQQTLQVIQQATNANWKHL